MACAASGPATTTTRLTSAGLLRKAIPSPERQKDGKDEDPEDNFRLAIHLLQPRHEQEFVTFPTASDRRIGRSGDR